MNRNDFELLNKNIVYFDNGATTLKPKCVKDAICNYYTEYTANAHRGDYSLSATVDSLYEGTREKIRDFINAKETSEIVFTSGTTNSANSIVDYLYIIPYGVLGGAFALAYSKTESVFTSMTFHMLHNTALFLLSTMIQLSSDNFFYEKKKYLIRYLFLF